MTNNSQEAKKAAARSLLGEALGFRDCRPDTLDGLVNNGHIRALAKGEHLAREGERFDMLCLVIEGSIEVSLLRADGQRHLVSFLQPGDFAGLISMVDGLGNLNDLRARGPCDILRIAGDVVRHHRDRDPAVSRAIELQLAYRSRLLYERLATDSSLPLESRLARLLRTLSGLYGVNCPDGVLLKMKISQADLADWLGVSRQRVNSVVQRLRDEGLIRFGYSTITILDVPGLEARSRC
ncbi:Crp/Fnr family transcriptional regulator [Cupriavidus necator]|uniref:Crp/Fnr family transcriptional regulator n=1 Tax=Cupriavidus necator TaxID=106590 RepID=UPI003ECEF369